MYLFFPKIVSLFQVELGCFIWPEGYYSQKCRKSDSDQKFFWGRKQRKRGREGKEKVTNKSTPREMSMFL